ncbi:hypothetical protein HD554DRAFT_2015001, partial [Boletus coccyginus]
YLIWESLAHDFLLAMASSLSSKHVFSSAGITISKCQNHLKGNIIKALQFQKCTWRMELLF